MHDLHSNLLNAAQRTKTNPGVGVLGLHSTLLDKTQNIETNPDLNLPNAQLISY